MTGPRGQEEASQVAGPAAALPREDCDDVGGLLGR